jgi:hypothetical protein
MARDKAAFGVRRRIVVRRIAVLGQDDDASASASISTRRSSSSLQKTLLIVHTSETRYLTVRVRGTTYRELAVYEFQLLVLD